MLGLLVKVDPYSDESLIGYLHRLAEANALSGVFLIDLSKLEMYNEQGRLDLIGKLNVGWHDIAGELATPPTRPMPLWNLRRRRFCGRCLGEKGYWSLFWDLSLVTCCIEHKTPLCDICRHCGKQLDWTEHITLRCPGCGGELASADDTGKANADELWLARELQIAFNAGSQRAPHLKHLSTIELHELAFRLGACSSNPRSRKPLKIADSASLATASAICRNAAAMLRCWPHGLEQGLDRIRTERGDKKAWKLIVALGPIYKEIFDRLSDQAYQFVRDAIERYILDKWEAPLALRHKRLHANAVAEHRWLSVGDAASRMDLRLAVVSRAAQVGEVKCRNQAYSNGRVARVVEISSLQVIADKLRSAVGVEEAARKLGLSKKRVVQLIHAGFLKIWGGTPQSGAPWLIGQNGIQDLLRPASDVPLQKQIKNTQISFSQLMRYAAREDSIFTKILTASLNGTIGISGVENPERRICDWFFERGVIESFLDSTSTRACEVGVVDAARALGVKQEVVYALVQQEVIKSQIRKINGRKTRLIRLSDIETFRKKYVFGRELAISLNCSPKHLTEALSQSGITAFGGPTSTTRPCRQYYWLRSSKLEAYLAQRADPTQCKASANCYKLQWVY